MNTGQGRSALTQEPIESVLEFMGSRSARFAARPALAIRDGEGWRELTYGELSDSSVTLASYLMELGIERGDRIGILSESSPEWGIALFGCMRAGAVTVPLDVKLTESELFNICSDCSPRVLLVSRKHEDVAGSLKDRIPAIEHIALVEPGLGGPRYPGILSLEAREARDGRERDPDEVALLVYTSGTTGAPKGVMTTFGNLLFQVCGFQEMVGLNEEDRLLSILPLNHLLELTAGFLGVLNAGGSVSFCHSIRPPEIMQMLSQRGITGMMGVPLFYKTLRNAIEREIKRRGQSGSGQDASLLADADGGARARSEILVPSLAGLSRLRFFVSGGAPLEPAVAEFFASLGIPLLQGYGLTETSPVISTNRLQDNRIGSVGPPLPGIEVKIALRDPGDRDGEIVTRGPHVMKGYWGRDDLTRQVIDADGWFYTGDLGYLDAGGYLYVSGRLKNLIVLGGGKKVFPEEVEGVLSAGATIKEVCVLGCQSESGFRQGTEEVCAVVVPADDVVENCRGNHAEVETAVRAELSELFKNLAPYKQPTRIVLSFQELPRTATRKVKRAEVQNILSSPP